MKVLTERKNIFQHSHHAIALPGAKVFGLLVMFCIPFKACIEPWRADIQEEYKLLSIEGSLVKGRSEQKVVVSSTSALVNPQFLPLRDCEVVLQDKQGNHYEFTEDQLGAYVLNIPDEELIVGRQYNLEVITPKGKVYESAYETMLPGAEVDTAYYQVEERLDKISGDRHKGVQFYIDLLASDSISRYFRWKLTETYEYTSVKPITYVITGDPEEGIVYPQNQTEFFRCWKTEDIRDLFISSTENLLINEKKKIPLNYISTDTDRLKYAYSLFIEQYTLSEQAYNYWLKNKNETQESGGLYTQQPGQPISNIKLRSDSTEQVLGYFWVSHMTKKRFYYRRINALPVIGDHCELVEFDWLAHADGPFPRYVWVDDQTGEEWTSTNFCFNCTFKGGTLTKPDFWER